MKRFNFTINNKPYSVDIQSVESGYAEVKVNGELYRVQIDREIKQSKTPVLLRSYVEPSTESDKHITKTAKPSERKGPGTIKAPLPGTIIRVLVQPGDTIKIGTPLIVLEAMKMENTINSDKQGVIRNIAVQPGATVLEGDLLIEID